METELTQNQRLEIKISALHPKVTEAARKTIEEAKARGMTVGLHSGLRNSEEQDNLYALGRTRENPDGKTPTKPMGNIVTNARAWHSWHNFGIAVDLVYKDDHGDWTWAKKLDDWKALGAVGKMYGFEWGGDWQTFTDLPHFQMLGKILSLADARQVLFDKGMDALWELV